MAWAHCALPPFPPSLSSSNTFITSKTLASLSSPSPSKPTKRKNYLRQKLLKTLTKPQSTPILPQENPRNLNETLEFPEEEELDIYSDQNHGEFSGDLDIEQEENDELRVLQTTEAGFSETPDIISTNSVVETVLYIFGLFVFQTVCAVWLFGSMNYDKKSGNAEGETELGISEAEMTNGDKKENFFLGRSNEVFGKILGSNHGGGVYVDKSQFEEKIVEVRAMAREVRESEAKKSSANVQASSSDIIKFDGNDTMDSRVKTNIQKEVDGRLSNLEKRLRSLGENSPLLAVNYLNNSGKVEDKKASTHLDSKLKDEKFVFKKKLKFRNSLDKPGAKPKGFPTVKDHNMLNENIRRVSQDASFRTGSDVLDLSVQESVTYIQEKGEETRELSINGSSSFQDSGRNLEKERENRSGGIQETSRELVEPRQSSKLKKKNSQSFTKEVEYKPMVKKIRDKRMDTENDLWWTNLPYALAILLRRGSDSEGSRGLYSLKMDDGSSSYTVAFEDRHDASYFCYILESFFQDLGDFSADVVPLSIKELKDMVKSGTKKLMVLRKGQIRLYAGQPLADVEMTLRSFVG